MIRILLIINDSYARYNQKYQIRNQTSIINREVEINNIIPKLQYNAEYEINRETELLRFEINQP